jgi:hypothetical protein
VQQFSIHAGVAIAVLTLPALIPLAAQGLSQGLYRLLETRRPRPFIEWVYGLLPLVLLGSLAHYLPLGLFEGGRILPVGAATIGIAAPQLSVLVAHPAVVAFLQGTALLAGALLSVLLTQKITRYPFS